MSNPQAAKEPVDHCPHCWATKTFPLSSGLYCTNDWHNYRPEPKPIVLEMPGRWRSLVWRLTTVRARRRAAKRWPDEFVASVQRRIAEMREESA